MAGRRHQGTAVRELVLPLNFLRWVECAGRCISHFPGRLVTDICCEVVVRQTSSSSRAHLNILTFLIVRAPRRALADADFDGESEHSVVVLGSSGQVCFIQPCCMGRQVFSFPRNPASLFDSGVVARMLMPPIWSTHLFTQVCRLYILYGLDFLPALPVG